MSKSANGQGNSMTRARTPSKGIGVGLGSPLSEGNHAPLDAPRGTEFHWSECQPVTGCGYWADGVFSTGRVYPTPTTSRAHGLRTPPSRDLGSV